MMLINQSMNIKINSIKEKNNSETANDNAYNLNPAFEFMNKKEIENFDKFLNQVAKN